MKVTILYNLEHESAGFELEWKQVVRIITNGYYAYYLPLLPLPKECDKACLAQ